MAISEFKTVFASLREYVKGDIEVIDDDPRNYLYSNVFDVASRAAPYEKVVVGKNMEYVIETLRAEGRSGWFAAPHDEFALIMDGVVVIELVKIDDSRQIKGATPGGSRMLREPPTGRKMGFMKLARGHQALLPEGAAYRFTASELGVIVLQTLIGPHSVEKWPEICSK